MVGWGQVLELTRTGIPAAVAKYGPTADGGWPEGPGYWCFVTKYLIAVSECLRTATGTDNGYMAIPGVKATALYAMDTHITPSGNVFNYGDAFEEFGDTTYHAR